MPVKTHVHSVKSLSPRGKLEIEFNNKTGKTVLIRCRAWPGRCSTKQTAYTQPVPFITLPLYFHTLLPPPKLSSSFPLFLHHWFLPLTSHNALYNPKMHPTVNPIPTVCDSHQSGRCCRCHSHCLTVMGDIPDKGLMAPLGHPWDPLAEFPHLLL